MFDIIRYVASDFFFSDWFCALYFEGKSFDFFIFLVICVLIMEIICIFI